MAPKRRSASPPASSSSEAGSSSSEEQLVSQSQQKDAPAKGEEEASAAAADEESESESESDSPPKSAADPDLPKPEETDPPASNPVVSDADSEPDSSDSDAKPPPPPRRTTRGPDPTIKPICSKPMDGTPISKKSSQQRAETRKRKESEAAEDDEEAATAAANGAKKPFQRVWTEEDEITILKGMIRAKKHGNVPESGVDGFLMSIHRSLHSEFSKTQLADKMRRLKRKYVTNSHRGKRVGTQIFLKPHDQAVIELSKKIWGENVCRDYGSDDMEIEDGGEKEGGKEANRKSSSVSLVTSEKRIGSTVVPRGSSSLADGADGDGRAPLSPYPSLMNAITLLEGGNDAALFVKLLSPALALLKPERAKVLEERWHKHFVAGLKYSLERSELKEELLRSLVEALERA